jgi:predicted Zn-dependent protease
VSIGFEKAFPAQFGVYDDERGIIFVNRELAAGRPLTMTIAHEVGHAMGLEHVESSERRSVMVPGNTDTPPGEIDREALIAVWGECSSR